MKISKPQQFRFFREWQAIVRANGWPHDQAETERHALLERAGFSSLKDVDHTQGYTAVLKELAALNEDLSGMLQADANGRRTMIWKIKHTVVENYWQKIARDRFGTDDLDALKDEQLKQLLFTVSDRAVEEHKNATLLGRAQANRRRRATPDPEARIKFPDLAIGHPAIGYPDEPEQPAANPCERCGSECNPETGECEECTERRAKTAFQVHATDLATIEDNAPF